MISYYSELQNMNDIICIIISNMLSGQINLNGSY